MQVYKDASAYQYHHPATPYSMAHSQPQQQQRQHSQHSQHSQYPYNPYPLQEQRHAHSQGHGPLYTLRDHATTPSATTTATFTPDSTSKDSTAPPQDMFFALERLLMGISPFPPSIPHLAKPTCPPLDDHIMAELSSPSASSSSSYSSSSPSSASASEPAEVLSEQSLTALEQYYRKQELRSEHHHQQPQHTQSHQYQQHRSQHHQQSQPQQQAQQRGSESSARSVSPAHSPYSSSVSSVSYASSCSPVMAMESAHDLPYWSPSTPCMPLDHEWSNRSSPLMASINQHQQQQQQQSSPTWGYPLFEQVNVPLNATNSQGKDQEQQHQSLTQSSYGSNPSSSTISAPMLYTSSPSQVQRRAARTPPHNRRYISPPDLSGLRVYESTAHYSYTHARHNNCAASSNNNQCCSGGASSSSSTSATNTNMNTNTSSNSNSTSAPSSSNSHSNNNSSGNAQQTNPRGGVKSYPCPTCTKPFPTRTQLKSHMAIHVDNFPFPCLYSGCDLHFKRKHDLRRHVDAKHALVKKYLCSGGCGEGFGRRDQMVRHLRRGNCGRGFQTEQ